MGVTHSCVVDFARILQEAMIENTNAALTEEGFTIKNV